MKSLAEKCSEGSLPGPEPGHLVSKIVTVLLHTFVLLLAPAEPGALKNRWSGVSLSVLLSCFSISIEVTFSGNVGMSSFVDILSSVGKSSCIVTA